MFWVFMAIISLVAGIFIPRFITTSIPYLRGITRMSLWLATFFFLAGTSYVYIDANEVGHLKRIYLGSNLEGGKIIATNGEMGYQAEVLSPGFHLIPLLTVFYDVEELPIVNIPAGFYGLVETRDGKPLPSGTIMAAAWKDDTFQNMLDATYFLKNGGQKGLQASVLKPGKYRLNLYLFRVRIGNGKSVSVYNMNGLHPNTAGPTDTQQTIIPAGHVGVVTSRIQNPDLQCKVEVVKVEGGTQQGTLSVPLVPKGCRGIWKDALYPGGYFLNKAAYDVTLVDTRVQTWTYAGGYDSRRIDLKVNQEGKIEQELTKSIISIPKGAADKAVDVKVEGWTVHQNLRALVQVTPENAPIVVAAVGSMKEVEDRVVTPAIWSEVRDVIGGSAPMPTGQMDKETGEPVLKIRPVRILDVVEYREALQAEVSRRMGNQGLKAGVRVMEIRFGNPDIPPEMLVARKREQLATQLKQAYTQERIAQDERIKTEKARATADKQPELVSAEIAVKVADQRKLEREKLGEAEKLYLSNLAKGERARTDVLGQDRVMMLNIVSQVLTTLENKPQLVKLISKLVPQTMVVGGGSGGLEGAAAVIAQGMAKDSRIVLPTK